MNNVDIFDVFDFNGLGHISVDEATLAVKTALTGISNLHAMLSPETAEIEGFLKSVSFTSTSGALLV